MTALKTQQPRGASTVQRNAAKLRQSKRRRRTFSDEYKSNVIKTLGELIQNAPDKIGLFLKKEGLTWAGVKLWKDQMVTGATPAMNTGGIPEIHNGEDLTVPVKTGGVRNMKVGRTRKYKNVTLDNLYAENLQLKERLQELEGTKKKVKLIIEMQNKMLDVLDVTQV